MDGDKVVIAMAATEGGFEGMVEEKTTVVRVNLTSKPKKIIATLGGKCVKFAEASSLEELQGGENMFYYEEKPELNRFSTEGTEIAELSVIKNPLLHVHIARTDITL